MKRTIKREITSVNTQRAIAVKNRMLRDTRGSVVILAGKFCVNLCFSFLAIKWHKNKLFMGGDDRWCRLAHFESVKISNPIKFG